MIKFTGTFKDGLLIGLGVSDRNIELLREGNPILIDLREIGIPHPYYVVILHGKTEQDILNDLKRNCDFSQATKGAPHHG